MTQNTPLRSLVCSIIPGLGQVYCGEPARGIPFLLGTFFSFFIWILGALYIPDLLGFGALGDYSIIPFITGVAIWGWSAYDAYTRAGRMVAGEIPGGKSRLLHMVMFVAFAVGIAVICFFVIGVLYAIIGLISMGQMYSHESPALNITITAEREGENITIMNTGNQTSSYLRFAVSVNDQLINQTYHATPGSKFVFNGTSGRDHVVVRMYNIEGIRKTLLDTYV